MYSDESCFLCPDNIFELHQKIGLPYNNAIVFQDKNVFVTPDISPICRGHFLIISKEHINSFGNATDAVFDSIRTAVKFLKAKVYKTDKFIIFEHGAVLSHTAGACIDHAHMHIIPQIPKLSEEIDDFIHKSCFIASEKICTNQYILQEFAKMKQPYLFYAIDRESWAYPVLRLPSQFLRSLVAYSLKVEYNWKLTYNSERSKLLYTQTLEMATDVNVQSI